jgi:hypothetical protein
MNRRERTPWIELACLAGVCLAGPGPALADPPLPAQVALVRPAGASGTVIVPDRFLRRWDPLTVFFGADLGPAKPGPEDHPERYVSLSPAHPGAFQWLDARTLQFRPAEPWPSLVRFTLRAGEVWATLATLMEPPVQTIPANSETGLDPVEAITLSFNEPLDEEALAQMLSIELRPLPGVSADEARWLTGEDFSVKTLERAARSDRATYVLALRHPILLGIRATVHFRLSLEEAASESASSFSFSTAEPFRVVAMGCGQNRFPVTPGGSRYVREQALNCGSDARAVLVEFSAELGSIGPLEGRNLVRFTPAVDGLDFSVQGRQLSIRGGFAWDTEYRFSLVPAPVLDSRGRPLQIVGPSEIWVYFPRKPSYLRWGAGQGVVERYGPQMVPVEGRGDQRVDLRIYPIQPLDRSFWPMPGPIEVDESRRPPGPGEEPAPVTLKDEVYDYDAPARLAQQIWALSTASPAVSRIVELPLRREGSSASFGLDLKEPLGFIAGPDRPGTYLVGLRRLEATTQRTWMRVQVTDLSLTTVEEPRAVEFVVTSLATGQPVSGAELRVEASEGAWSNRDWRVMTEGTTDAQGRFRWELPEENTSDRYMRRIVVEKDGDTLVLDPTAAPDSYADNQWFKSHSTWLQWTQESLYGRGPSAEDLCHIFTERPVYRPEEVVHIKGYLRRREQGTLEPLQFDGSVVVEGPGDVSWRYPVSLSEHGSFYHAFSNEKLPTGTYRAHLEDADGNSYGHVAWLMEAYRIPDFETQLHAPEWVSLDRPFEVTLTANYYAGGRVAGQPVRWRVTQFPYAWSPKRLEGFLYSSDERYSQRGRFQSTPALERDDVTGEEGSAKLALDPTIEPTSQPRSYVVEATVTGADDQTVTATRRVLALPPFALGLKVPRYLEQASRIEPQILAADPKGELIAGQSVTIRLLHRQWHSHLRASDFSDGVARYITDVVDEKIFETKVQTTAEPLTVPLAIERAGVYVVEIEAHDRLHRAQTVSIDLYAGGAEAVSWAKPASGVFTVASDQDKYDPGQTAALVLRSPFQTAEALAIVEAPDGNRYEWLHVEAGQATFQLPIEKTFVPRVPVHFVLMRGRVPGPGPMPGNKTDLGKPMTLAATEWVQVNPVDNQVQVALSYPEKARPGQTIQIEVGLGGRNGAPLAGEVTLWLVDAAVLALGKEQRLDPLPDFITQVSSHLQMRDTRGLPFGLVPFAENPGGDEGEEELGLLDQTTVRRNFKTVPFYDPAIQVGEDGKATVTVELPDNLTNFKLRAKAVSGPDRFGFATGQIAVRLPLIVQPALPRFVRPGDRFTAAAIGRVVEGEAGPGSAEIRVQGVTLQTPARRELSFVAERPERIEFPVQVPDPPYTEDGRLAYEEAIFSVGVERASDQARDAFEVRLPIRDDRQRVASSQIVELAPGKPLAWPAVPEPARPGTVRRSLLVSDQPALLRMAGGLSFLLQYPYGCTEQKVSRARAALALKKFRDLLHLQGSDRELSGHVQAVFDWLPLVLDPDGRCAFWPGSQGYVSLTAWVVEFLLEAREAGYPVDPKLLQGLTRTLEQALRSDYSGFIDGEAYAERTWALSALAAAGKADPAYAAELSRKAQFLDLEGLAQVLQTLARSRQATPDTLAPLVQELWKGVVIRLHQGREIYGGLQERRTSRSGLILPSETRTVAEAARALARLQGQDARLQVLIDALVTLGRGNGWGSTNANSSALLALAQVLQAPFPGSTARQVELTLEGKAQNLGIGPEAPVAYYAGTSPAAAELVLRPAAGKNPVAARLETSYVPQASGTEVAAGSSGLVVSRELLLVRGEDQAWEKIALDAPGKSVRLRVGDVVEEHVQVVNPEARNYVAVVVPLAAGMEPLNPALATAPPEARPRGQLTLRPAYVAFLDDQAGFYFDELPKGTYDFYFRTRASTEGRFIQPAAKAEMMYDEAVRGNSPGAAVEVVRVEEN